MVVAATVLPFAARIAFERWCSDSNYWPNAACKISASALPEYDCALLPGDRRNARFVADAEPMIWLKITPPMLGVLSPYLNRAGRQHLKPHAARPRVCLCQAPDYRTPVRPALVLLEPNRGKLLALDRWLVNANQLIRD